MGFAEGLITIKLGRLLSDTQQTLQSLISEC